MLVGGRKPDPTLWLFPGIFLEIGSMFKMNFIEKSDKIFADLCALANEELRSSGLNVEPSVIVNRIISPLKDLYLRNLTALLESLLTKDA
jgi:hypothetical protein